MSPIDFILLLGLCVLLSLGICEICEQRKWNSLKVMTGMQMVLAIGIILVSLMVGALSSGIFLMMASLLGGGLFQGMRWLSVRSLPVDWCACREGYAHCACGGTCIHHVPVRRIER